MCVALTYGLEISSVTRQGNSPDVSCAFFQDPADLDEVAYKLFDYAKECCDYGFFPESIHRMDMHTRYIWKDSVGCENLSPDHEWEHMGLDVETFKCVSGNWQPRAALDTRLKVERVAFDKARSRV